MLQTSLVVQDAKTGRVSRIIDQLTELGASAQFGRMRVAMAYATRSGCQDLVRRIGASINRWRGVQKQWLVSIDFGRTEVNALQYLDELPNSEVRISDARELLDNHLMPSRCFHPKTIILDSSAANVGDPFAISVGSANMTLSGMRAGVEHAMSLVFLAPLSPPERDSLRAIRAELVWWDEAWGDAVPLTAELLREYGRIRPRPPREDATRSVRTFTTLPARRAVEVDPGVAWANARYLWIQTHELYHNRGAGRPGNQVDLRRGTRVYFGFPPDAVPRNTVLGSVTIQYDAMRSQPRSVRFGNNFMDKVNLPIPGEDGPDTYDHS